MGNTIKIQDLPVFYLDKGRGSVVLILHGWGSNSAKWIKVQDGLVADGFRIIVPDLPGFGKTPEPLSTWTISDYSKFVYEFTNKLNIDKLILAGHSFGGRISIDYAVRYPQQLDKLILISAAGVVRHEKVKIKIFLLLTKIGNTIFSIPILRYFKPIVRQVVYKLTGNNDYKKSSEQMQKIMKRILDEDLRTFLPSITIPTLILWGENDVMTPVGDAEIINKEVPNSYLYIFDNQPHALNLTIPQKLAKQISAFLVK